MKKLMLTAAIICVSVFAQAASVSWGLSKDDNKTYGNKSIYAIAGGDYTAVTALLKAGGDSVESAFLNYAITIDVANSAKSVALTSRGAGNGEADVGDATTMAFFVFKDSIADGQVYDTTGAIDISGYRFTPPEAVPGALEFDPTAFASTGNPIGGQTPGPEPTPEPTSGLLLLLGMAGLALKRKLV